MAVRHLRYVSLRGSRIHPEGMGEGSRWSSEERATTTGNDEKKEPRPRQESKNLRKAGRRMMRGVCDASGTLSGCERLSSSTGGVRSFLARPPANRFDPSGIAEQAPPPIFVPFEIIPHAPVSLDVASGIMEHASVPFLVPSGIVLARPYPKDA